MVLKKGYKQLIEEAHAKIQTLSTDEAKEKLGQPDVLSVDLRDVRELERGGAIPGAFLTTPRGVLEFRVDPESPYFKPAFDEDKQWVLYCQSGWRWPPARFRIWASHGSATLPAATRAGKNLAAPPWRPKPDRRRQDPTCNSGP